MTNEFHLAQIKENCLLFRYYSLWSICQSKLLNLRELYDE
jgi:hypothetical protein